MKVTVFYIHFLQYISNLLQIHKLVLYIYKGLLPGYVALFYLALTKLLRLPHLRPDTFVFLCYLCGASQSSIFLFLVTLFLYFFFSSPQEVGSFEVGIYCMA